MGCFMLDKAIEHKKEHRKPYNGSKSFDRTCRNHGACKCCVANRNFSNRKRLEKAEYKEDM